MNKADATSYMEELKYYVLCLFERINTDNEFE